MVMFCMRSDSFRRYSTVHTNVFFFFFNDTATTEIYTLSLHDALPISASPGWRSNSHLHHRRNTCCWGCRDRKSTRLNSSHLVISYAVFCLKKKKNYTVVQFMLPYITLCNCLRQYLHS